MKPFYQHTFLRALFFGPLALVLASCGSYQYAGYDHDGIYSNGTSVAERYTEDDHTESYEKSLYYQQVFSQKADEFGQMAQGSAIFTDIDSYSSGTYQGEYVETQGYQAYGGWGDQADEIAINIYNDPFIYPPYYSYYGHYYHPFSAWNYGYGYHHGYPWYYSPWHYSPWRYGGYGPWGYASVGWGYGYGHWGYGYNNWGYGNYRPYYNNYYNVNNVSYNNSRRYSASDYSNSAIRRSDATTSRRYNNSSNVRANRSYNDNTVTRSTRATNENRTYRTRNSDSSPVYRSTRSTERTGTYTPATRSRTESYTPSRSTRSNNSGTYRSSSPVRSSGTSGGGGTSRSTRGGRGN